MADERRTKMLKLTRNDIEKVYDEIDRRISLAVKDGDLVAEEIFGERVSLINGMCATLSALLTDTNWQEVVQWMDAIENERGYWPNYGEGEE